MFGDASVSGIIIVIAIVVLVLGRGKIMPLIKQFRKKETPTGESKKSKQEDQSSDKEDSEE